jgi:hypothetical protein
MIFPHFMIMRFDPLVVLSRTFRPQWKTSRPTHIQYCILTSLTRRSQFWLCRVYVNISITIVMQTGSFSPLVSGNHRYVTGYLFSNFFVNLLLEKFAWDSRAFVTIFIAQQYHCFQPFISSFCVNVTRQIFLTVQCLVLKKLPKMQNWFFDIIIILLLLFLYIYTKNFYQHRKNKKRIPKGAFGVQPRR